jgi:two-component system sensor histidine kinase/response regulator
MNQQLFNLPGTNISMVHFGVTQRSNRLINYFLGGYFLMGLVFASFYGTWLIGIGLGGLLLVIYYSIKIALPASCLYQYVLSVVLGLFMAQFIYQMHGMIEMHFFAFIGSALLITYQNWKLQLPMLVFVLLLHFLLGHLQDTGYHGIYFNQLHYFDLHTFVIHIVLTMIIYLICGLCAYQLHRYHRFEVQQTEQMELLQEAARLSIVRDKNAEALEQRNVILESIGDAFFAVDKTG